MTERELKDKIKILEYAMSQDFNFDSKDIPDSIIDLMIKKITVFEDHFEWKLNFFNEAIKCSVDGSAWSPTITIKQSDCLGEGVTDMSDPDKRDSLPVVFSGCTGRYKRTGEIRHKPYYLLTLICTEEDAFDHFSHSSQKYDIRRFDNIVFDVYV